MNEARQAQPIGPLRQRLALLLIFGTFLTVGQLYILLWVLIWTIGGGSLRDIWVLKWKRIQKFRRGLARSGGLKGNVIVRRLIDLGSRNGTFVNGQKALTADLREVMGPQALIALDQEGGAVVGRGHVRLRRGLVVAQVALSLLLLVGAGLFTRSLWNLRSLDPGFEMDQVITFSVDPGTRRRATS